MGAMNNYLCIDHVQLTTAKMLAMFLMALFISSSVTSDTISQLSSAVTIVSVPLLVIQGCSYHTVMWVTTNITKECVDLTRSSSIVIRVSGFLSNIL